MSRRLDALAAPLLGAGPFSAGGLAAWAGWWPGLDGLEPATVREVRLETLELGRSSKLLRALRVAGEVGAVLDALRRHGLDLGRGYAEHDGVHYFAEARGAETVLEAHAEEPARPVAERLDALARPAGFPVELLDLVARQDVRDVALVRDEGVRGEPKLHVVEEDGESRLVALGFREGEVRGVPVFVRGPERVFVAGGTWYAYVPELPPSLAVGVDED